MSFEFLAFLAIGTLATVSPTGAPTNDEILDELIFADPDFKMFQDEMEVDASGDAPIDVFGKDADIEVDFNGDGVHDHHDKRLIKQVKRKMSMQFCAGSCWEFDDATGSCYIPEDTEHINITCGGKSDIL